MQEIFSLTPALGWGGQQILGHVLTKCHRAKSDCFLEKLGQLTSHPRSTRAPFSPHPLQNVGGCPLQLCPCRGVSGSDTLHCSECLGSLGVPLVCAPIVTEPCTFRDTLKLFYTKLATYIPTSVSPSWPSPWPKNQWSPETKPSNVIDITIPGEHSAQGMEVKSHRQCYAGKHSLVAQESWRNQAHIAYVKDLRDSWCPQLLFQPGSLFLFLVLRPCK